MTLKEFTKNYKHLIENDLLKFFYDHERYGAMKEFFKPIRITKRMFMAALLIKNENVQPNRLMDIIGKKKVMKFIRNFSIEQEKVILEAVPGMFIYFMTYKKSFGSEEAYILLKALFKTTIHDELKDIVLKKFVTENFNRQCTHP